MYQAWNNCNSNMIIDVYVTYDDSEYILLNKLVGNNVCVIIPIGVNRITTNGTFHQTGIRDLYLTERLVTRVHRSGEDT